MVNSSLTSDPAVATKCHSQLLSPHMSTFRVLPGKSTYVRVEDSSVGSLVAVSVSPHLLRK